MSSIRLLYRHQRVTIMGLGLCGGGAGAARFWSELGAEVIVTDLKSEAELAPALAELRDLDLELVLGAHREQDFKGRDLVMVNPAVKPGNRFLRLARNTGARVATEVGLTWRLALGPVIAVTGSNGKSTTTALIGAMLQAHDARVLVGGNLGGSLLPALKEHPPSVPLVLELSSFQLHYLKEQRPRPAVAVVTNLSPNHLDWHGSALRYYEDKKNIIRWQEKEDFLVLNVGDPVLRQWAEQAPARVVRVDLDDPGGDWACFADARGRVCLRLGAEQWRVADLRDLRLPGRHNRLNALQACAAAFLQCRDTEAVSKGLRSFTGLPHRLEFVTERGGVRFVNDSMATTPESAVAALHAFREPVVIIAGGYDKGVDLAPVARAIRERARAAVLIGKTAPRLREAITRLGVDASVRVLEAGGDFARAVDLARAACPVGGVVLLSPACASYDMFANFEARGQRFRELALGET